MRNNFRIALVLWLAAVSRAAQSRTAAEILSEFDRASPWLQPDARDCLPHLKRIGKPMALEFEGLLGGEKISTEGGASPLTSCVYRCEQNAANRACRAGA